MTCTWIMQLLIKPCTRVELDSLMHSFQDNAIRDCSLEAIRLYNPDDPNSPRSADATIAVDLIQRTVCY